MEYIKNYIIGNKNCDDNHYWATNVQLHAGDRGYKVFMEHMEQKVSLKMQIRYKWKLYFICA